MHQVEITADDIAKGKRGDGCNCPLALAIKRRFPNRNVLVGFSGVEISDVDYRHNAPAFVIAFDKGEPVSPCVVTITGDEYASY